MNIITIIRSIYSIAAILNAYCIVGIVTAAAAAATTTAEHKPRSIQSGPDSTGSTFVASILYDSTSHSILLTGSTFGQYFATSSSSSSTSSSVLHTTSNCFITNITLFKDDDDMDDENNSNNNNDPKLQFQNQQVLGNNNNDNFVNEACVMSIIPNNNNDKLFTLGYSEVIKNRYGTFEDLLPENSFDEVYHYGVIIDMEASTTSSSSSSSSSTGKSPYRVIGGRSMAASSIVYPIMMITSPSSVQENAIVYVVAQESSTIIREDSESSNTNTNTGTTTDDTFINTTISTSNDYDINSEVDPMRYFKYGDNYIVTIYKLQNFRITTTNSDPNTIINDENAVSNLRTTFEEDDEIVRFSTINPFDSIHVTGISVLPSNTNTNNDDSDDIMIIVGTTSGYGKYLGSNGTDSSTTTSTLSGFITKVYIANGTLVTTTSTSNNNDASNIHSATTRRIESISDTDTEQQLRVWTAGICYNYTKEPDAIYIIGATEGPLSTDYQMHSTIDAYIMKLNVYTLEYQWVKQISSITTSSSSSSKYSKSHVRGISCAISHHDDTLWIGGVVQGDGIVQHADTVLSYGGDDIFIQKLDSRTGESIFTRQIGSSMDDGLAMRGGIVIDQYDNCIVAGNTYGSMYRVRNKDEVGYADDRSDNNNDDTNTIWISDVFVTTIRGTDGAISYPIGHPEFVPQPGMGSGDNNDSDIDVSIPKSSSSSSSSKSTIIILTLLCLIIIGILFYIRRQKLLYNNNSNSTTDRTKVIQYLNDFDVEDIDLKHSATGGWHCFYSNDLSNGHNNYTRRTIASSSSSSSSLTYHHDDSIPIYDVLSPIGSISGSSRNHQSSDPLLTAPLNSTSNNSTLIRDSLFMNDNDYNDTMNQPNDLLIDDRYNANRRTKMNQSRSSVRSSKISEEHYTDGLLSSSSSSRQLGYDDDNNNDDAWGKEIL